MGWAAIHGTISLTALLIYAGGVFWTLGYDTIYAHQDKRDDEKIGVRSSARRLGTKTKPVVLCFYLLAVVFWCMALAANDAVAWSYVVMLLVTLHFAWQSRTVQLDNPASCLRIFKSNIVLGGIIFLAFLG